MDSQQICDTEPYYLDSSAELSGESDSEEVERIPTKGKRKISRPVQPVLELIDQEANEQENFLQCTSRYESDRRNYSKLSKKCQSENGLMRKPYI